MDQQHTVAAVGVGLVVFVVYFVLGTNPKFAAAMRENARFGIIGGTLAALVLGALWFASGSAAADYVSDPTCAFDSHVRFGACHSERVAVLGTTMQFQRT